MTPFAALRARAGWSIPFLARALGYARSTVEGWERGIGQRGHPVEPPAPVLAWLRHAVQLVETAPRKT